MATCNASTLLQQGAAFQACSKKELQIIIAQLLCNLSASGGGGVSSGNGSPVGVVTPSGTTAIYFDRQTGQQYNWYPDTNNPNGAWH